MRDELGLTIKQRRFVEAYVDPHSPTFLNGRQAVLVAYATRNLGSADGMQCGLLKHPKVRTAVQERLESQDISELIVKGVRERLRFPFSKHWQETADFVAKILGLFDPVRREAYHRAPPVDYLKEVQRLQDTIRLINQQRIELDQTRRIESPGSK